MRFPSAVIHIHDNHKKNDHISLAPHGPAEDLDALLQRGEVLLQRAAAIGGHDEHAHNYTTATTTTTTTTQNLDFRSAPYNFLVQRFQNLQKSFSTFSRHLFITFQKRAAAIGGCPIIMTLDVWWGKN